MYVKEVHTAVTTGNCGFALVKVLRQRQGMNAPCAPRLQLQMIAQARRPKQTKTTARQAHGIWEQHQGWIVLGIVLAITVVLIYFFVSE